MGRPLRVLIVDDSEDDAVLLERYLTRSGYDLTSQRVDSSGAMQSALTERAWDIVIADHDMPGFSAPAALEIRNQSGRDLPFIIVSGAIREDVAVSAMRAGAHDFLTKENLARLVPAIERELREAADRAERRRAEDAIRFHSHLLDMVENAVIATDLQGTITYWNRFAERMYGWSADEAVGRNVVDVTAPNDREQGADIMSGLSQGASWTGEFRVQRRDGTSFPAMVTTSPVTDAQGRLSGFVGVSLDISERKRSEEERDRLLVREQSARADAEAAIQDLRRIQAVTDVALSHLDMSELLHELLKRIRAVLNVDNAAILLTNSEGTHLTINSALGPEQEVAHTVSIPIGQGFAGRIAASGQPFVIEDLSGAQVVNPFLREKLRSVMGVPLMSKGRVVGVIHVGSVSLRRFPESEVRLLQLVAVRVVTAIEQARLFEAERQARAEAQEAAQLREEFLAIASHELKTPLTGIKGYVQLLNRLVNGSNLIREDAAELVAELDGQVVRLQALVADLLDASQIARGRLDLHVETVDLSDLAARVLARFDVATERTNNHVLGLDAPEKVVGCWDELRIEQVLSNLVSNAIKYSPDGGEILVSVSRAGDEAEVRVSDQGIGIPDEEQGYLFQPFVRGRATRSIKGTGLGLFIVARIVQDHGGTVTVESKAGEGTTFVVRMPLSLDPQPVPTRITHPV